MNVFDARLRAPVTGGERLWGREAAVEALEGRLLGGQQGIALVGPEGSGKTSLLQCFFSTEYRKKMILEKRRIITAPEPYPVDMTCTEVYYFFREIIVRACALLEDCGRDEDYLRLLDALPAGEGQTAKGQLSALVDFLHGNLGYSVTLVLDCFEEFTCSPSVTHEHHDMLNGLIDRKNLQFVVATNYDMTKVVLGTGSYLIQKFGSGLVRLEGLDQDACRKLADGLLEEELRLGNGAVRAAQIWSGGNPALLLALLSRCYELKKTGTTKPDWDRDVAEPVYQRMERLLDHWCRHLDDAEISALLSEILHYDARPHSVTSAVAAALARLQERGLVARGASGDAGQYDFCCAMLRRYLERSERKLTPEYLGRARRENDPLDMLRDSLRSSDFSRVKGLLSSLEEKDMPLFLNQMVAHYGTESAIAQREYEALSFTPEEIVELQKRYPREGAMVDDAIRAARVVGLLDGDGPEDIACDYSMYVYAFGRPCELRLRDAAFPLVEAWPDPVEVRRMMSVDGAEPRYVDREGLKMVNYENFLRHAAGKLARVGAALGLDGYDAAPAWTALANDIGVFRRSRNKACHPNDPMDRGEARRFVQTVYTQRRLFQRLAVCLPAAAYLLKKPNAVR